MIERNRRGMPVLSQVTGEVYLIRPAQRLIVVKQRPDAVEDRRPTEGFDDKIGLPVDLFGDLGRRQRFVAVSQQDAEHGIHQRTLGRHVVTVPAEVAAHEILEGVDPAYLAGLGVNQINLVGSYLLPKFAAQRQARQQVGL